MQEAEFVVGLQLAVFPIIFQRFLVIAQTEQSAGFLTERIGVFRVDGNGKFRTGDGIGVILVHQLCGGQCIPVLLGVGVMVDEFVEDALGVFVLTQSEECASHEFLEVVAFIASRAHHPFIGFLALTVVNIEIGAVAHVVLVFVGFYMLAIFAQIFVGLLDVAFGNHDFRQQIVVVGVVSTLNLVGIEFRLGVVFLSQGLAGFEDVGQCGARIELEGVVDGLLGFVVVALPRVVVGEVH